MASPFADPTGTADVPADHAVPAAPASPASGSRGNLALYRRYRPATFAEVIGQEHVTAPLSVALEAGRVNHAYLFSGPRGCGKTSSARILARSLNCAQGPTATPCGVCDSCRELAPNGAGSIDVIEIDAASHNGVDDARDLRERAYYTPARDRFKVYIIDEAHMVTSHAFNALLKVVEEPPDHIVFVFATTEPDKVLQTIRSRTHHYPFRLVAPSVLRGHLERIAAAEGVSVEPAVYPLVVRAGAGSVRDALSLLDQLFAGADAGGVTYRSAVALLGVTDSALIDDMIDALAVGDAASVYATVDKVIEAGHEPRRFATDLLDRLRDLLILDAVPDAPEKGLLDGPADAMERMRDQASRIGTASAARYAETVHTALIEMRGTTAPRLLLELVCARMLLPDVSSDSAALLQRLDRIERMQRMTAGPVAGPSSADVAGAPTAASDPRVSGSAPSGSLLSGSAPAGSAPAVPTPPPSAPVVGDPGRAAQPAANERGGLDVTAVRALWPEVLDAVRANSRRTRALLDSAQVAGINGHNLRLVMATAPLVRMLGEASNADVVTTAMAGLLPGPWTMQVEVGTDITAAPELPRPSATGGSIPSDVSGTAAAPGPTSDTTPVTSAPAPEPAPPTPALPTPEPPTPEPPTTASPSPEPPKSQPPATPIPSTKAGPERGVRASAVPSPPGDGDVAADSGGWPTVARIPGGDGEASTPPTPVGTSPRSPRTSPGQPSSQPTGSPTTGAPKIEPPKDGSPKSGSPGAGSSATTSTDRPGPDEPPDEHDPFEEYPDDINEGDPGAPAVRHDPETQALDLLKNGLGAQPVD